MDKQRKIEINMTRKMLILRLLIFIPIAFAFVIAINYYVDAENIYYQQLEGKMARELLTGKFITNIPKHDERLLQKGLIKQVETCPEYAIWGSSRLFMANSSNFNAKTFLNHGMSGASVEDLLITYYHYSQKECYPENIIIAVDPWIFNDNNIRYDWKTMTIDYNNVLKEFGLPKIEIDSLYLIEKEEKLFSIPYFLQSLSKDEEFKYTLTFTNDTSNNLNTRLSDGSLIYGERYRFVSEKAKQKRIEKYLSKKIYGISWFRELSSSNMLQFEKLLVKLKSLNQNVIVALPPYHPKAYVFISEHSKYELVLETEKQIKEFCKENNIRFIGSFNPDVLNFTDNDFIDAHNLSRQGVDRFIRVVTDCLI